MKITASDLLRLGVIEEIVPEPLGGAHRDKDSAIQSVGAAIERALGELDGTEPAKLKSDRSARFLAIGRSLEL